MRIISLLLTLACTSPAVAWELIDPNRRDLGAVSVTRIVDIMVTRAAAGFTPGYWVRFADDAVGDICRQMGVIPPDDPDPSRRLGMAIDGRYVLVPPYPDASYRDAPPGLALMLFAQAHAQAVKVKIRYTQQACEVIELRTCNAPDACPIP